MVSDLCILAGVLALIKARGAAHPEGSLLWRADFAEIGWFRIMTWKPMATHLVSPLICSP
jgi:hypothetical protein